MMSETIGAAEFQAKCLDLLDQVGSRQIERVEITRHGKVVAILMAPVNLDAAVQDLHGFMRGSVIVPDGVDLAAPVSDEPWEAEAESLHG